MVKDIIVNIVYDLYLIVISNHKKSNDLCKNKTEINIWKQIYFTTDILKRLNIINDIIIIIIGLAQPEFYGY